AECKSYRDRLFHWIKNGGTMKGKPGYTGNDREMQDLVEATRIAAFPPDKMKTYKKDIMTELDIIIANRKSYRKGLAEGEAKGKAEGIAEGAHDKALSTAKNMLAKSIDAETIAECTGLSLDEVRALL
ncbi:MAG: hypothetical protein ACI4TJ_04790, partial [Candidatus Cryptobacteroides sp.]